MTSQAIIPALTITSPRPRTLNVVLILTGVFLLSILAQFSVSLPFTPVPITGQTFGVVLVSLLWGSKRATTITLSYLGLGALGLPIFALGKSGILLGPTIGYLFGMLIASYFVGLLADHGFTSSFRKSLAAAFFGSLFIFGIGLLGLSFFVPMSVLIQQGLLPFIPGMVIKNVLAASIACSVKKKFGTCDTR